MASNSPSIPPEAVAALEDAAQPVIILDDHGHVAWLNTVAVRTAGLSVSEATGRRVAEVFPARTRTPGARSGDDAYFQALFENAQDIITILNRQAVVEYESPSVERSLGYKPAEMVGRDGFGFIHPDDMDSLRDQFATLIAQPNLAIETSFRARHKDGSWRVLEGVATNLLDNPIVGGVVVNIRDITLRRHAEEHLRERTAELEQLNRFMVGRELRMIELKKEVDELRKELELQRQA